MKKHSLIRAIIYSFVLLSLFNSGAHSSPQQRHETSLNGQWQIAKTNVGDDMPTTFTSTAPVPGLVDMAQPAVDVQDLVYQDAVYWYKRTFAAKEADKVLLKINKAKYHTRVWLNGEFIGENTYNFTPGIFDLKPALRGEDNELIISVGCENNAPDTVMTGHDFEKTKYIPGIYDDVKIISTGYPFISNVQTVPNIDERTVQVVAHVEKSAADQPVQLSYEILETATNKVVGRGQIQAEKSLNKNIKVDFKAAIKHVKLWTPETPHLYTLKIATENDSYSTRFGMRSFTPNPNGTAYLLNGKPYFMRGTNVCIFRFFEDPDRGGLPWDDEWAITLHNRFKEMGWNSIRYCIGFPPERWYDIADSLGFLIQNEYPIWTLNKHDEIYPNVTAAHLADEFRDWLPEHWNHPCVVIWDAQNESVAPMTTEATKMVRHMDLSNRLWENGWAPPADEHDPYESHPYLFGGFRHSGEPSDNGPLSDFLNEVRFPTNDVNNHLPENTARFTNPIIINEYAWLWLNRDGSTTTLTDRVYDVCFGTDLTTEERIDIYTKHLGMLSEYWRAHRLCAGVLHFCGLAYSRPEEPRGQTSDHFIDIKNLTYEPKFVQHVKPAFSPVGIMINYWELAIKGGQEHAFEIYTVNDLESAYTGSLKLSLQKEGQTVASSTRNIDIEPYDRKVSTLSMVFPDQPGNYKLVAEILVDGESVKSIREFEVF